MLSTVILAWILISVLAGAQGNGQLECKSRLLSNLPDSAFTSSSDFSQKYSAAAARLSPDDPTLQYRAWCPKNVQPYDESEFLEIDLGHQSFVKLIITKGLSTADKGGLHLTPHYFIWYRREAGQTPWIKYQNYNGTKRIKGNLDAQTERYVSMNPPFVARWVRLYPYTQERMQVCLKLEIIGCGANGVVEYQASRGSLFPLRDHERMVDTTYDNQEVRQILALGSQSLEFTQQTFNSGGLGKLVDGKPDDAINKNPLETNAFVGWRRHEDGSLTEKSPTERIVFRFDDTYNFSAVSVLMANRVGSESALPLLIEVRFSRRFPRANPNDPATTFATSIQPQLIPNAPAQWTRIDLLKSLANLPGKNSTNGDRTYDTVAIFVELSLHYGGPWMALAEVKFENDRVEIPSGLLLDKDSPDFHVVEYLPQEDAHLQNASIAKQESQLSLSTMQPHTYALVVGLGCLAFILIALVLALFFHWRRRAFVARNKLDEHNRTFQHPSAAVLLMKSSGGQPTQNTLKMGAAAVSLDATTSTGHSWDFYNSHNAPVHLPVYLNGDGAGYVPGIASSTVLPRYLLQGGQQQASANTLILPNYLQTPLTTHRIPNGQISPEHSSNSGNETEVPQPLFPYYQLHPQTTNDNATVYNTVTDADPYVNGTPRPHQMLRIPPPPSIPLPPPPPPSNPGGTACLDPWGGGTIGREKELIQHSSMNSTQSAPNNNFYRYSLPVNGGFPATPVYSAPVWTATSGEDPRVVQQAQAAQHFPMSQEASDLPDYCSTTPVSSIIYGGFYGHGIAYREPPHQQSEPRSNG